MKENGSPKRYKLNSHPAMRAVSIIVIVGYLLPLFVLLIWSFTSLWPYPDLIPDQWTLRGYESLLRSTTGFLPALGSSLIICLVVCVAGVAIATLAAQALAFYEFKGKQLLDFFVYMPVIVPSVVFGIGVHVLFIRMGLNNTVLGVILVQLISSMPFAVRMMTNATRMMGDSLTEQAVVLGSSRFKAFFQIAFHPLLPTMIAAACMISTVSLGDYFLTFLIGGGQVNTFATILVPMISGGDTNITAAYTVAYLIVSFAVFLGFEAIGNRILRKRSRYLV